MQDSAAVDLYNLLVTRDFEPEILDAQGKSVTDPAEAEMFSFDWKTQDQNYGTVVALLGADNNLEIYFGDNLGRGMEPEDRREWYQFLEQMKQFASRNIMDFEINNLSRLKYTMQGMAAIKEGLFEGYYGTRKVSYSDQPKKTRLMIRHSRDLGEGDARHRNIEALFVETEDGNRFRLPFKKLIGGRAMARHISEGGTPYDAFGQRITEMMTEMDTMARFVRAARNRGFDGEAAAMVESAIRHYADLKARAKRMISQRGYREERDSFRPDQFTDSEVTAEAIRDMFIEQTLDHRIEEALPVLARIAQQESSMMEADQFESWANEVAEGRDPNRLQDLMAKELIVGPDATNATEQLYGVLDDEQLFDILRAVAEQDPDTNAWEDPAVQRRLGELGIEMARQEPEIEATPMPEAARGRPAGTGRPLGSVDTRDDGLPRIGKIERTPTGLKHSARPERGGTIPEPDRLDTLDKPTTNRLDQAFGVKWKPRGPKGLDPTAENFGGGGLQGAPIGGTTGGLERPIDDRDVEEDLDTDGVMMNKPSNMSSESIEQLKRLAAI
ncbi:MAG: hypothetical protein KGR21_09525 [Proteobacteria bacterium]|nr:hypothetical protein [Pseudomonadota bacterium]